MKKRSIDDITPPGERKPIRTFPIPRKEYSSSPESSTASETPKERVPNRSKLPDKASISHTPLPQFTNTRTSPLKKAVELHTSLATPKILGNTPREKEGISKEEPHGGYPRIPSTESIHTSSRRFTRIANFLGLIVALAFVYFLYLFLNTGATVSVTPKSKAIVVKGSFSAKKNPTVDDLPFTVITLTDKAESTVATNGEKKIERRATGKIVVYNKGTKSQRLVKNTRFESVDGHIFKLENSIVVPAAKGATPGSIEAVVNADSAGEDYNISLSDFTIPGFKGDPRFIAIFGRSKTTMTNGYKGVMKTASASDLATGEKELQTSLKAKLTIKAREQVPSGYLLYDNAIYVSFAKDSNDDDPTIKLTGTLHGILFSKDSLASFLAKKGIEGYQGEGVTSLNLYSLFFLPNSLEIAPWDSGNLPFTLTGTSTVTWLIDKDKLVDDLRGVAKTSVSNVFKRYPGIESAEVSVRPTWKSTLPEDKKKIEILIKSLK